MSIGQCATSQNKEVLFKDYMNGETNGVSWELESV